VIGVPEGSLQQAAEATLQASSSRVIQFDWQAQHYIVKRHASKARSRLKHLFHSFLNWLFFRPYVTGNVQSPADGRFEITRIRALRAAGIQVPEVALELPEAVVYQYCGVHLRQFLSAKTSSEQKNIISAALDDLANFHRAGQWHGGAQFRNLIVREEQAKLLFCRIDFEEDLGGHFALPLLQIFDLCLFLLDALSCVAPNEREQAGLDWMQQYQKQHWSAEHQDIVRRLARGPVRFALMLRPLAKMLKRPEINQAMDLSLLIKHSHLLPAKHFS
jgi:tRNA A-37 threonylcarbamoyl transferase component Bud32